MVASDCSLYFIVHYFSIYPGTSIEGKYRCLLKILLHELLAKGTCKKGSYQKPVGPNQPKAANAILGTAGIPNEQTNSAQSFLPNVIFLFKTTITKAENKLNHFPINLCVHRIISFSTGMIQYRYEMGSDVICVALFRFRLLNVFDSINRFEQNRNSRMYTREWHCTKYPF